MAEHVHAVGYRAPEIAGLSVNFTSSPSTKLTKKSKLSGISTQTCRFQATNPGAAGGAELAEKQAQ